MTTKDFFDTKTITAKEIVDNFQFVKEYDIDAIHNKGCFHCGNTSNLYKWKSEPWTSVDICYACDCISLTYYSDRMGGCHTDTVRVYEQKNRPTYRLYYKCSSGQQEYGDAIQCRICGTESFDKEDIKNHFCKVCNKKHD